MKRIFRYVLAIFVLAGMVLSACAGAPAANGGSKVEAIPVAYTGTIESINGNQWTVNGLVITVDPSVVRDGPFNVGDTVKVEVNVNQDGTLIVTRVEIPSSTDLSQLPSFGDDNSNGNANDDNSNDVNSNDVNANDVNSNDDNSNSVNSNDANSNSVNSNDDNSNGNTNDDSGYSNDNNSNDDNSNAGNGNDDKSNDNSGKDSGGNDNGGGKKDDGGNDNGGNSNG